MTVTIGAAEQAVYPPRVAVTLAGLTLGDVVDVYREVAGNRTLLRSGSTDDSPDTGMVLVDAELPFGVPVTYVAVVESVEYATSPATYTLTGGKVALTDAVTGLSAEVVILAAGAQGRTRDSARFHVAGRNLVVSRALSAPEGSYDLFVETTTARDDLMTLLAAATEGTVQLRQSGGYDGVDAYLSIDEVSEARWSQDGSDERRIITVSWAEVQAWASTLAPHGFTYGDVASYYTGLTYADAAAEFSTYLEAEGADYS